MTIRTCGLEDFPALLKLLGGKLSRRYPFQAPRAEDLAVLLPGDDSLPSVCEGVFVDGELKAAASFGVLPESSGKVEFGIIKSGDGIIDWLVCSDIAAGQSLLEHCLARLPRRTFAFPCSFGAFRRTSLFSSGMLPDCFEEETKLLRMNGFSVPASDSWGPQERICFKLDIPDDIPQQDFPAQFTLSRKVDGPLRSSLEIEDAEHSVAGVCIVAQCSLFGRPFAGHVYICWLMVCEQYRKHGFGAKLLLEQLRWAREEGASVSVLTTHSGRPAHHFYRKLGYSELSLMRSYMAP
jgi:GNAT superfamily N-acetyltransferase